MNPTAGSKSTFAMGIEVTYKNNNNNDMFDLCFNCFDVLLDYLIICLIFFDIVFDFCFDYVLVFEETLQLFWIG